MKLKSLNLKAFGPFTDRILEFNSTGPGLHVIFGPNEAGKSSALRGLKALLFGFHPQTPDNFLHSYEQLLVGGHLENDDGQELSIQRRKKRINDLLDGDGNPLDTRHLNDFLPGVEPDIFESLYGINHHGLVEGGKELLAQQGEVGRSLFAAGAGISSLRDVIAQLDQEASDLFKPQGSKPEINRAIKRFKELQREVKDASLAPKQWKELKKALEEAETERAGLEQERDAQNMELRRLERLERAIPELASLKVWRTKRAGLGDVVTLPPNIRETSQQIEQALDKAKTNVQQSSERLKRVDERLGALSLNTPLLEQSDVIDDFHQRLGEYRKGQKDRPERNGMRINLRTEASLLLKHVRPDIDLNDVDSLRPMLSKKRTIQSLSSQFEAISQNVRQTARRERAARKEHEETEQSLSARPPILDTHELELSVKLARKAGNIDDTISKAQNEVTQGRTECHADLQRIGLWSGDVSTITDLPLPLPETIQKFEQKYHRIDEELRALTRSQNDSTALLNSAEAELKKIQFGGDVPTEQDLHNTRNKRDTGWQLLRRHWLEHEDVSEQSRDFDSARSLPDAFEGLITQADIIADRLRNEADRVISAAHFKVQAEQQNAALAEYNALEEELRRREEDLSSEWSETWKKPGISPLSPKEMNGWLTAMEKLRYRVEDLSKKEKTVNSDRKHQQELIQNLRTILTDMSIKQVPSSENLAPVLVCAETLIEDNRQLQTEREHLVEQLAKAQKNVTQAKEEHREAE